MKKLTEEWIKKAEDNYQVACRELKAEPAVPDAVCFHAQQCLEKYLKAILQENDVTFQKTHDLDVLLQQCKNFIHKLEDYRDELVKLSTYAVDVRYPGFELSVKEAKICVEIMKKARGLIRDYFQL